MIFQEGVFLALQQIRSQKLKSVFSLLGVILGVMFLILVVTVVEGLDRYVREDFTSQVFGINTVTLRRWQSVSINTDPEEWRARQRRPRLYYDDADAIRAALAVPSRVAVESGTGSDAVGDNGRTATGVQVTGASPEIFEIRDLQLARGRAFTPQEAAVGAPVIVLGFETAEVIFEGLDPIDRTVRLRGFPYRVIGVLEERGSLFGQSLDNLVIAPARSPIQSITNPRGVVDQIIIQTLDPSRLREAQLEVEGLMRARRGLRPADEANFTLETADEAISFWDNISRLLFLALPMLVSISLVVGGIVIMNIMLVSVMERTREIGVRKALGARRKDILLQVLIESATLSTLGACIGVLAGLGMAAGLAAVTPLPAAVAPRWIALGVGMGLTVGIVAGVYPAARASRARTRWTPSAMSDRGTFQADRPLFATLLEGLGIAWEAISANRIRSALTVLGVAVGVAVVMAIAALITGLRSSVMEAFESAGPNNFVVTRFDFTAVRISDEGNNRPPWWNKPEIVPEEARRIGELPTIDEALYNFGFSANYAYEGETIRNVQSQAYSSGWPRYQPGDFLAGRDFTPAEVTQNRPLVVVSEALATDLFGSRDPIGRYVRVGVGIRGHAGVVRGDRRLRSRREHLLRGRRALGRRPLDGRGPASAAVDLAGPDPRGARGLGHRLPGPGRRHRERSAGIRGLGPREENNFAVLASAQIMDLFNRLTGVFFLVILAARVGRAAGRRRRRHRHHAHLRDRADSRDRHPQGGRRHPSGDPVAVPGRGIAPDAGRSRHRDGDRLVARGRGRDPDTPAGRDPDLGRRGRPGHGRRDAACCSDSSRRTVRAAWSRWPPSASNDAPFPARPRTP